MFAKGGSVDQFKKGKTEELNLERDFLMRRSGLLLSAKAGNLKVCAEADAGFLKQGDIR
jgi:hypothetical protein